jgi:hypothetical protein
MGFNKPYGMRFDLPLHHELVTYATLHPGLHEIWIYRNGTLIKAGPLWDVTPSSDSDSINCGAMDILDYLDVRTIATVSYSAIDQTAIAWNLITQSQAKTGGDLGIISGTLNTGISRSGDWRTFDNKYVLEAIQDISDMNNGFDFNIDPTNRSFNAYWPRPQRNQGLTLRWPTHIRKYSVQFMGKWVRNSVYVTQTDPNFANAVDTTSRTTYGLREYADSYRDAATTSDLSDYASKVRDQRKEVKAYPTIVVDPDLVNIFDTNFLKYGDLVNIDIQDGYTQIQQQMRYITAQVSVDKQGSESYGLYLQDPRELN